MTAKDGALSDNLDDVTDRYQRIQIMAKEYPLTELCLAFAVSRSGYYDWCARKPSARQQANTQLLAEIQTLRQSEEACYGSPRRTKELQACGQGHPSRPGAVQGRPGSENDERS